MNERRKGEIALILAKDQMSRESVRFSDVKRELGNLAKKNGDSFSRAKRIHENSFRRVIRGNFPRIRKESGERKGCCYQRHKRIIVFLCMAI